MALTETTADWDRALAAGLSHRQMFILTKARRDRDEGRTLSVNLLELAEALLHPAAFLFDESFVRRELVRHRR